MASEKAGSDGTHLDVADDHALHPGETTGTDDVAPEIIGMPILTLDLTTY